MEELLERITVNDRVLCGKPTIRGMRISVEQLLRAMAAGVPEEDLLSDYPELEAADLRAAQAYAAEQIGAERVYTIAAGRKVV